MATTPPPAVTLGPYTIYGRKWIRSSSLYIAKRATSAEQMTTLALDLSPLRFSFQVQSSQFQTPNMCTVRIYNPSNETAKTIVEEFDQLSLTAGYQDYSSIIFTGTIRQYKRGREGNTDTFLELLAATSDMPYQFGFINTTIGDVESGAQMTDLYKALCDSFGVQTDYVSEQMIQDLQVGYMPRGRAAIGLNRAIANELALSIGVDWSIQTINGVDTMILTKTGQARPGEAVVLDATSGLVGVPEATPDGIMARCLLNPLLQVGSLVQINQELIATTEVPEATRIYPLFDPAGGGVTQLTAPISKTGFYQAMAVDHSGDTRGQDWYTDLICLAADQAVAVAPTPKTPSTNGGKRGPTRTRS